MTSMNTFGSKRTLETHYRLRISYLSVHIKGGPSSSMTEKIPLAPNQVTLGLLVCRKLFSLWYLQPMLTVNGGCGLLAQVVSWVDRG